MAGGKLSARQKMINLMYLVFIAMLAMNMSKEVLSAFGFMNEELTESIRTTSFKNNESYLNLNIKAQDQKEKFGPLKIKSDQIKSLSNDLNIYLDTLKAKITKDIDDLKDYESMDKPDVLDEYFFVGDKLSTRGKEFKDKINSYRDSVVAVLGSADSKLISVINKRFNTDDYKNKDGKKVDWVEYRYKGFPVVASLTNFSQIQGNIKNTESDILSALLGNQLEGDSKLTTNNYKGIVRLEKTAYFSGERVKGQVVLGRYDDQLVPSKVTLGKKDITKSVENGQVLLDMPAGNVGPQKFKGVITFMQDGEAQDIPFESSYSVIALPSEAIISADKMNVVYRGLDNPISISVPGIGENNIKATVKNGNQLKSKGKGKYDLTPGLEDELEISVSAKISPQKTIKTKKIFRIKTLPAAQGSIRGRFNRISMPSSSLPNITLGANYPDFMYDLNLKVISFKVAVPGEFAVEVKGDRMTQQAQKLLKKARRGDKIDIYDIKAKIIENNYILEKYCIDITVIVDN
jgi:gliding motility-associated protein GldM